METERRGSLDSGSLLDQATTKILTQLILGACLLKAGRTGKPHFRNFQMSHDFMVLRWESPNKDNDASAVPISSITEMVFGQTTKVFRNNPLPGYEGLSFSLIYQKNDSKRSLDLVCRNRAEFDTWTKGIKILMSGSIPAEELQHVLKGSFDSTVTNQESASSGIDVVCDVYLWGSGSDGKLGNGEAVSELEPKVVVPLLGEDIRGVSLGSEHCIAVSDSGKVFTWGCGRGGRLGHGNTFNHYAPINVQSLLTCQVMRVAAGVMHSAVVTIDGEVLTFGYSGPWLGYDFQGHSQPTPKKVDLLNDYTVSQVACGANFTLVLTVQGKLFAFGENDHGQLGLGHLESVTHPTPLQSVSSCTFRVISAGTYSAAAITVDGALYMWGCNDEGQLGTTAASPVMIPLEVQIPNCQHNFVDVCCGSSHSILLSASSQVYCSGSNLYGEVGAPRLDNDSCYFNFTPVDLPEPVKVVQVACGGQFSLALSDNGSVFFWGRGKTCYSMTRTHVIPSLVPNLVNREVQRVFCGETHMGALVMKEWVPDAESSSCMGCKLMFTTVRRRHHCRSCGGLFCHSCTSKRSPILALGISTMERVCDRCHLNIASS